MTQTQRITQADLDRALTAHINALEAVGVQYDGRLGIDIGSKTYGRAYRLFLTDKLDRCQERRYLTPDGRHVHFPEDHATDKLDYSWDHADCTRCNGTRLERCSGHYNPPIGSDYLGMTAREAWEALTTRTATIYQTADALRPALPESAGA